MKKRTLISVIMIVVGVILGMSGLAKRGQLPEFQTYTVKKTDLIQEVSVTGRVKTASDVRLGFERSGKVLRVLVKAGDVVKSGQELVRLENSDYSSSYLSAVASLRAEEARLLETKLGARPEELELTRTRLESTQRNLKDAEENLETTRVKADTDLKNALEAGLFEAQKALAAGRNALITLTDLQYAHFLADDQSGLSLADAKARAVEAMVGIANGGRLASSFLSGNTGGAAGGVAQALVTRDEHDIQRAATAVLSGLSLVSQALDLLPQVGSLTAIEKTQLAAERSGISAALASLSSRMQALDAQKNLNMSALNIAHAQVTNAQNTVNAAQKELDLKLAGSTAEQIKMQQARVDGARAGVGSAAAQLNKTILRAPVDGRVTRVDARVGEIVNANASLVLISSIGGFEIEASIPETDAAKLSYGQTAKVTLDAYGADSVFDASVAVIEPAATIIEGVPTFKTTIRFAVNDERIKVGLTANVDIQTAQRHGTLAIPQRAIELNNGQKEVTKLDSSGQQIKTPVKTGLVGGDGNIEILEGLHEGDIVVLERKDR